MQANDDNENEDGAVEGLVDLGASVCRSSRLSYTRRYVLQSFRDVGIREYLAWVFWIGSRIKLFYNSLRFLHP
jgi:hypothetical protein